MKRDKEELDLIVLNILKKNNANAKLRDAMYKDLETKFKIGVFEQIYLTQRQPSLLEPWELYVVTKSLHENFKLIKGRNDKMLEKLNPDIWFVANEMIKGNEIKYDIQAEKMEWFELNNVDIINENMWSSTYETYQNLVNMWDNNIILYNKETQREGKIKYKGGKEINLPTIVEKNVDEISTLMMEGNFFPNMITLNLRDFGGMERNHIEYNPIKRILRIKITTESIIDLIDGMHRIKSSKRAIEEKPETKGGFAVRLFNLDVEKAQAVILQESKGTALSTLQLKKFDSVTPTMLITKRINDIGNSNSNKMYDKITADKPLVERNLKYCYYSNIENGIIDNFSDLLEDKKTVADRIKGISKYLVDFYNCFLYENSEKFENLRKTKDFEVIADINVFTGLTLIAKKLYDNPNWEDKFKEILSKIDWSRQNIIWDGVLTNSITWNKINKVKIYKIFDSFMEGVEL